MTENKGAAPNYLRLLGIGTGICLVVFGTIALAASKLRSEGAVALLVAPLALLPPVIALALLFRPFVAAAQKGRVRREQFEGLRSGGANGEATERVDAHEDVYAHLRIRARTQRYAAQAALAGVLISIVGGASIFLLAGQIVQNDDTGPDRELRTAVIDSAALLRKALGQLPAETVKHVDERAAPTERLAVQIAAVKAESEELDANIERLRVQIEEATKSAAQRSASADSIRTIVATIGVRFAVVALIVFLVQILVSVYRHATRLASFYDARADAILAVRGPTKLEFVQALEAFSTDKLGFEKDPKTIPEDAIEAVKEVALAAVKQGKEAKERGKAE